MDWKSLIADIRAQGLSQIEIGRRIGRSQAWVAALVTGKRSVSRTASLVVVVLWLAGLSAYLNLDVTLIRILLVILVFVGVGFVIPVYIVIWFVAPEAITAAQRLEMQGEDVTVESIKTELNNARSYVQSDKFKQSAGHVGSRVGEVMQTIMRVVFGLLGALLGVVGVVLVGALLVLLVVLIFEPTVMNTVAPEIFANWTVITPEKMVLLVISLILVVGCPIFLLVYWAIQLVTGKRSVSRTASLVVVVVLPLIGYMIS